MNYVIFDLEYNQINRENRRLSRTMRTGKPEYLKFEILQIGAIKLDDNLKYVSNFKMYVKPKFLPVVNEHVLNILNVSEDYIRINGLYFSKVFDEFKDFLGDTTNTTLVTWSGTANDFNVIGSNLRAWHIKFNINNYNHIDLQRVIMNKTLSKLQPSLERVAPEYDIDFNKSILHDAYGDASITKQLFQKIGIEEANAYNYEPKFKISNKLKRGVSRNIMLINEIKKVPHCNHCGKFIKTIEKTNFYLPKNGFLKMSKLCYCDKCNAYVFKDYRYEIYTRRLIVKDKFIHKNNIQSFTIAKKELDLLKEIEFVQLYK